LLLLLLCGDNLIEWEMLEMERDPDSKSRIQNSNSPSSSSNNNNGNVQRSKSFAFRAPQENFTIQDFELGKIYGVGSYSKVWYFFLGFFSRGLSVGLLLCYWRLVGCVCLVIITIKVCISYSTFQFLWFISLCLYYHYLIPARNLKLIFTSNTCIFLSCMGLIFWFWSRGEISFEGWQILWNWISFVWFPGKLNEDKQFFFCNLPLILSSLSRKRKPNTNVQF